MKNLSVERYAYEKLCYQPTVGRMRKLGPDGFAAGMSTPAAVDERDARL